MSGYDIDSTTVIVLDAYMELDDLLYLLHGPDELPECCFVYEMEEKIDLAEEIKLQCMCKHRNITGSKFCNKCGSKLPKSNPGSRFQLPSLSWYGDGSGDTYRFFVENVAPKIKGEAQVIFTWSGGDSFTGLAIKDGKVAECEVIQSIKLPKDW